VLRYHFLSHRIYEIHFADTLLDEAALYGRICATCGFVSCLVLKVIFFNLMVSAVALMYGSLQY